MTGSRFRTPPKFKVGDIVRVTSKRRVRFDGLTGKVIEVKQSRHAQSLDKYVVQFETMSQPDVFWDIELRGDSTGQFDPLS
jgi:hypothetical protein